jgi:polysaccharide biosynthesis/export protein
MLCSGSYPLGRIQSGLWLAVLLCTGCHTVGDSHDAASNAGCAQGDVSQFRPRHEARKADLPHELAQVSLSSYVIEAPDVLQIDAMRLIPKPPYKVSPLDVLGIQVDKPLPDAPITGFYTVDPEGIIDLGFTYGRVRVEGMTLDQAKAAIHEHLKAKPDKPEPGKLREPFDVTVILGESRGLQQIRGPHLVRLDGTVGLGIYGSVFVDGMTLDEARATIETHMSEFVVKPEISVDVLGFNSKVFYVVTDGGGSGEQVARLPMTGKTTILDAVSQIGGLTPISSKHFIYLVRPTPAACDGGKEVYKICWNDIVRRGCVGTNYQVLPGDRIYVHAQPLVTIDTQLSRFLSPFERLFGDVGLGNGVVRSFITAIPRNANNAIFTTPGF